MPLGSHSSEIRKFFPVPIIVWNHSKNFTFAVQNPQRKSVHSLKSLLLLQYVFLGDISWLFPPFIFLQCWFVLCGLSLIAAITAYWSVPFMAVSTASSQAFLLLMEWLFLGCTELPPLLSNWVLQPQTANILSKSFMCNTLLGIWSWLKNKTSKTANEPPTALSACSIGNTQDHLAPITAHISHSLCDLWISVYSGESLKFRDEVGNSALDSLRDLLSSLTAAARCGY